MGDDYSHRIEVEAKKRFLELLKDRFNSGIIYKGKKWKWDTIILNKTKELTRFFLGKSKSINFDKPPPILKRSYSIKIREKILTLTQKQAKEFGISKSTLHYLRKKSTKVKSLRFIQRLLISLEIHESPLPRRYVNLLECLFKKGLSPKTESVVEGFAEFFWHAR